MAREHTKAIHELRNRADIVITRPDKGSGVVLLNKADYIDKIMKILSDTSKFEFIGSCIDYDRTGHNERALQAFLLRLQKAGKNLAKRFMNVRPVGSMRPRMYGLPKVHKPQSVPLQTIISKVLSVHHQLTKWLD